jgi:hypothetical protein
MMVKIFFTLKQIISGFGNSNYSKSLRQTELVNEDTCVAFDRLGPISISSTSHATSNLHTKMRAFHASSKATFM